MTASPINPSHFIPSYRLSALDPLDTPLEQLWHQPFLVVPIMERILGRECCGISQGQLAMRDHHHRTYTGTCRVPLPAVPQLYGVDRSPMAVVSTAEGARRFRSCEINVHYVEQSSLYCSNVPHMVLQLQWGILCKVMPVQKLLSDYHISPGLQKPIPQLLPPSRPVSNP